MEIEKGMVIKLDLNYLGKIKEIQGHYLCLGITKTAADIAVECAKNGIDTKILNLRTDAKN